MGPSGLGVVIKRGPSSVTQGINAIGSLVNNCTIVTGHRYNDHPDLRSQQENLWTYLPVCTISITECIHQARLV